VTDEDGRIWLPLHNAAIKLGKSSDAVRSMIRRGRLSTRKANDGRLLVAVPTANDQPGGGLTRADDGRATVFSQADDGQTTAELQHEITEIRERLARAEERAEAARAIAAADVATAKAEAVALRELVDELKAQLADARRPWWRRWFG
jgi:hypothetical protein